MKLTNKEIKLIKTLDYKVTKAEYEFVERIVKGRRHVWQVCIDHEGLIFGCQTADLIDGQYTNHKQFNNLCDALRRPL